MHLHFRTDFYKYPGFIRFGCDNHRNYYFRISSGSFRGSTPTKGKNRIQLYLTNVSLFLSFFSCNDPEPLQAMCIGALARSFTGITMLPVTVIKTRFEVCS